MICSMDVREPLSSAFPVLASWVNEHNSHALGMEVTIHGLTILGLLLSRPNELTLLFGNGILEGSKAESLLFQKIMEKTDL